MFQRIVEKLPWVGVVQLRRNVFRNNRAAPIAASAPIVSSAKQQRLPLIMTLSPFYTTTALLRERHERHSQLAFMVNRRLVVDCQTLANIGCYYSLRQT
jgi:hypothetical protein